MFVSKINEGEQTCFVLNLDTLTLNTDEFRSHFAVLYQNVIVISTSHSCPQLSNWWHCVYFRLPAILRNKEHRWSSRHTYAGKEFSRIIGQFPHWTLSSAVFLNDYIILAFGCFTSKLMYTNTCSLLQTKRGYNTMHVIPFCTLTHILSAVKEGQQKYCD